MSESIFFSVDGFCKELRNNVESRPGQRIEKFDLREYANLLAFLPIFILLKNPFHQRILFPSHRPNRKIRLQRQSREPRRSEQRFRQNR